MDRAKENPMARLDSQYRSPYFRKDSWSFSIYSYPCARPHTSRHLTTSDRPEIRSDGSSCFLHSRQRSLPLLRNRSTGMIYRRSAGVSTRAAFMFRHGSVLRSSIPYIFLFLPFCAPPGTNSSKHVRFHSVMDRWSLSSDLMF